MKRFLILTATGLLCTGAALADDLQARVEASRAAVAQFGQTLKGELQAGMKAGGPVKAIEVCKNRAPVIAADISRDKGWHVGRTSLKVRNPDNAPDAWERRVLEQFEQRKAAGEDPTKLEFHEIVDQDGARSFRYMKAIPTAELCVTCHGAEIDAQLARKLDELYPQDQARGFKVGDLRGAFTIEQPM